MGFVGLKKEGKDFLVWLVLPPHPRQMEPEEKHRGDMTVSDVNLMDWNDGGFCRFVWHCRSTAPLSGAIRLVAVDHYQKWLAAFIKTWRLGYRFECVEITICTWDFECRWRPLPGTKKREIGVFFFPLLGNGTINDSSVDDLDSSGQPCCWELLCVFGPAIVVGDRFR